MGRLVFDRHALRGLHRPALLWDEKGAFRFPKIGGRNGVLVFEVALRLVARCASQQYDLSEEPGCVTGIRFVFSPPYGKGHGVVGLQFNLP